MWVPNTAIRDWLLYYDLSRSRRDLQNHVSCRSYKLRTRIEDFPRTLQFPNIAYRP